MSDLTQDPRLISISSPLPKDELLLTSFEGLDQISGLFEYQVEVLSKNHAITPDKLIGKTVTVTIQNDQKPSFNGYINRFVYGEVLADNLRTYHLTMVPWLWFLSKTNNHRIFQEKTAKEIVTQVFKDLGFNDFDFKATGNPKKREYCVQHNESDLNFVSRLLEEDGIAYYFEQKKDSHVMQIVDAANAYQECAETKLTYSKGNQPDTQLSRWEHIYNFRKGNWSLNDYDFTSPTKSQLQTTASTSKFANVKNYEHYEYTPYHDFSGIKDLTVKLIEAE
jgi:type VI secretion system secreted protein VgrG